MSYIDVMSNTDHDAQTPPPATLSEFFASAEEPAREHSGFTPEHVAEFVRKDRDASV